MSRVLKPSAHWQINGHYANSVDATKPVSLNSGTEKYDFVDGKLCFNFDGSTDLSHAAADTDTIAYTLDGHRYACVAGTTYYKDAAPVAPYTFYADATSIGTGLTGKMRDVTHWPVELTADELAQDFAMSLTPSHLWEPALPIPQSAPMFSPVGAWGFDDGLNFQDVSGNGKTLTNYGTQVNGAGAFIGNGVNQNLVTPSQVVSSGDMTVVAWIKSYGVQKNTYNVPLSQGHNSPPHSGWAFQENFPIADTLSFIYGDSVAWRSASFGINPNTDLDYHLYVVTVKQGTPATVKAYVDSSLVTTNSSNNFVYGTYALSILRDTFNTSRYWWGEVSGVAIYSSVLTDAQIKQIYRAGVPADRDGELLNLTDGYRDLSTYNRTLTRSNVVRYPDEWMEFNGSSGFVSTADIADLTGDITIECEFYADGWGESAGRIIDNGKIFLFITDAGDYFGFTSDGGVTYSASAINSIRLNKPIHAVITRTAAGITNFILNGSASGTADQSSGTPAAGTTNLFVGNRSADDRTFDGKLRVRIIKGIKTAAWAKRRYARTRVLL